MSELTLIQKIKKSLKEKIANITWKVFLWSIGMKAQQYWTAVYREERISDVWIIESKAIN